MYINILECRQGITVRKYWNKASLKTSLANSKHWYQKALQIFQSIQLCWVKPIPFTCTTSTPVSSSPRQGSQDSGISNIRFSKSSHVSASQFYTLAFLLGLNSRTPQHTSGLSSFLKAWRQNSKPISSFLNSKVRITWPKLPSSAAYWQACYLYKLHFHQLYLLHCLSLTVLKLNL